MLGSTRRGLGGITVVASSLLAGCGGGGGSSGEGASSASAPSGSSPVVEASAALAVTRVLGEASPGTISTATSALPSVHEGNLTILQECSGEGRTRALLGTTSGTLELASLPRSLAGLRTGAAVRATGIRQEGLLLTSSLEPSPSGDAGPVPSTTGEHAVAILVVSFQDLAQDPSVTLDSARGVLSAASEFYREASSGQTWLSGDAFGPFTIPVPSATADVEAIAATAIETARRAGLDLSPFQHLVFVLPFRASVEWWGRGTIGGAPSHAWINGRLAPQVLEHELGHGFGLYHSHSQGAEYGDVQDVMGMSLGQFSAFQKERLGWLAPDVIAASGAFRLAPFEAGSGPRAIKVPRAGGEADAFYYIEARRAVGVDVALVGSTNACLGVSIRAARELDGNSSVLVDAAPATSTLADAALLPGATFQDAGSGVTITTVSADETGALVQVVLAAPSPLPPGSERADDRMGDAVFAGTLSVSARRDGQGASGEVDFSRVAVALAGQPVASVDGKVTISADGSIGGTLAVSTGAGDFTAVLHLRYRVQDARTLVLDGTIDLQDPSGSLGSISLTSHAFTW